MMVRLYDSTKTNGGPPGALVQDLRSMIGSKNANAIAAAVRFFTIINWAAQYKRLPYGGALVNCATHTPTVMKPSGILMSKRRAKHELFYSFVQVGTTGSSEMRAVLAANGTIPFPQNVTDSVVRHNSML